MVKPLNGNGKSYTWGGRWGAVYNAYVAYTSNQTKVK